MKATKKYLMLIAACAALSVSAVAFTACGGHTHTLVKTDAVDATCTTDGKAAYWTCSDCEKMFSDAEAKNEIKAVVTIPAGHKLTKTDAVDATCTEDGNVVYWTCSACEKKFSDENAAAEIQGTVTIPATGHGTLAKTEPEEYSCMEAYWTCPDCEKLYSDEEAENEIAAPVYNHDIHKEEGWAASCTVGGQKDCWTCWNCSLYFSDENATTQIDMPEYIKPTGHSYGNSIVTADKELGDLVGYECANCGMLDPDHQYTYFNDSGLDDYYTVEAGKYYAEISEDVTTDEIYLLLYLVNGQYNFSIEVTNGTVMIGEVLLNGTGTSLASEEDSFTYDGTGHAGDYLEVTLMFEGASTFIISVEGEAPRALNFGDSTIQITDTNVWVDEYSFTSTDKTYYTITVPEGIDVGIVNPKYDPDDWESMEEPCFMILNSSDFEGEPGTATFKLAPGETIHLVFCASSVAKGKYSVTIAEGEPNDILGVGLQGGVGINAFVQNSVVVGNDVTAGEYVITVSPMMGALSTITVNGTVYELTSNNNWWAPEYTATINVKPGDVIVIVTDSLYDGSVVVTLTVPQVEEEA